MAHYGDSAGGGSDWEEQMRQQQLYDQQQQQFHQQQQQQQEFDQYQQQEDHPQQFHSLHSHGEFDPAQQQQQADSAVGLSSGAASSRASLSSPAEAAAAAAAAAGGDSTGAAVPPAAVAGAGPIGASSSSAPPQHPSDPAMFEPASLEAAAHAAIDSGDDAVVAQFLLLLEAHRARCERQQLYVEAALVAEKLAQLRAHEDSRRAHDLSVRHLAERLDLEEAHILEFDEFAAAWAEKLTGPRGFDADTRGKLQTLKAKHARELEGWTQQEQEQLLLRPKFSKQLLQLRATQESLAKARDYVGAERVRLQAAQLERVELDALKAAWGAKAHTKRTRFLEGQQREEAGFLARRAEERSQLEARKRAELQALVVQKYANLKSELERAHAKERARLERRADLGVSDSATIREEAPRRTYTAVAADEAAAWNAGVAAGSAMRNATAQRGAGANQPGAAAAAASARSTAAAQSILGGASGTSHLRLQNQGSEQHRRRIEEEQEAMLRDSVAASSADPAQMSSAAEVPTIASALNARSSGAPTPYMGIPPYSSSASSTAASPSFSSSFTQPLSARTAAASSVPPPPPSSSQLLQQQRAALQAKAAPLPLTARKPTSTTYDPMGSARRPAPVQPRGAQLLRRSGAGPGAQQVQQPVLLSARQAPVSAATASLYPDLQRAGQGSSAVPMPYTSRHALAGSRSVGKNAGAGGGFLRQEQKEASSSRFG